MGSSEPQIIEKCRSGGSKNPRVTKPIGGPGLLSQNSLIPLI